MSVHEPVLRTEIVSLLAPGRGGTFVDCTVGLGGHARALLESGATRLVGIDRDSESLEIAREKLAPWGEKVLLAHADYRQIDRVLSGFEIDRVEGIVADLGLSSYQLAAEGRGFSFQDDSVLDMRMDRTSGRPLADLLDEVAEDDLADVIYRYGEERYSRRIARAIVHARRQGTLRTTRELAEIVRRAIPRRGWSRIDPATRTFQALRIWTNDELGGLDAFVEAAFRRLSPCARRASVAFHSLEDRIVKHKFRALERDHPEQAAIVTRKPVTPSAPEVEANPRSRSAKLRVIERRCT